MIQNALHCLFKKKKNKPACIRHFILVNTCRVQLLGLSCNDSVFVTSLIPPAMSLFVLCVLSWCKISSVFSHFFVYTLLCVRLIAKSCHGFLISNPWRVPAFYRFSISLVLAKCLFCLWLILFCGWWLRVSDSHTCMQPDCSCVTESILCIV